MPTIAEDIMTSPVLTVSPETSVAEIVAQLARGRISALPVVGPDGSLQGIVSEVDVLIQTVPAML